MHPDMQPVKPKFRPSFLAMGCTFAVIFLLSSISTSTVYNHYNRFILFLQPFFDFIKSCEYYDTFIASFIGLRTHFMTVATSTIVAHYVAFYDAYLTLFNVWCCFGVTYLLLCGIDFVFESIRFALSLLFLLLVRLPFYVARKTLQIACWTLRGSWTTLRGSWTTLRGWKFQRVQIEPLTQTKLPAVEEDLSTFTVRLKRLSNSDTMVTEILKLPSKLPGDVILVKDLLDTLDSKTKVVLYRKNIRLTDYNIVHHNETLILIPSPVCLYEIK